MGISALLLDNYSKSAEQCQTLFTFLENIFLKMQHYTALLLDKLAKLCDKRRQRLNCNIVVGH